MKVRLSLCTTCMGRLHHLRQTLPENLAAIENLAGVQIVLLDYASPDGLANWVRSDMAAWLQSGHLVYYRYQEAAHFQMSHAKNLAHRAAGGDVLCNLDADNYAGRGFAEHVLGVFDQAKNCLLRAMSDNGACGRIAVRRADFFRLGGYDERMQHGWGYEDRDFTLRAQKAGLTEALIPKNLGFLRTIEHSSHERTMFARLAKQWDSRELHRKLSEEAMKKERFTANLDGNWGAGCLTRNFNEVIELPEAAPDRFSDP